MRLLTILIINLISILNFAQQAGHIFIENKNQWNENIIYKAELRNGSLYACKDGLVFDFFDEKKIEKIYSSHYTDKKIKTEKKINKHAYKVEFINSNQNKLSTGSQASKCNYNYFIGKDRSKWGTNAKGFHQICYENIYQNIDLKLYSKFFNLKYDLIIKPKGNPEDIKFRYYGVKDISIKKERLHIYTSVNHIIEDKPIAFQVINGVKHPVKCNYHLENKVLSYDFPDGYNANFDLIIDPTLIFSTFSGSYANNFGYSATFDSKGFLYSGSSVFGQQYPTTFGAYDTTFGGGTVDVAISKFDTLGSFMHYSTYIGGSDDELPHSLIVNGFDELFIMGTTSSNDFPTTENCYDSTFNGGSPTFMNEGLGVNYTNGSDIFVTHLSANGDELLGSTYIGGSDNDGLNSTNSDSTLNSLRYNYADEVRGEIEIDNNNNIYIGSCTMSADFPTSNSSFQPSFGGGNLDGCIFKFDNSLQNLIWSSFLGGENSDAVYSISLDNSLDLYCSGGTNSMMFPVSENAYQGTYQGGRSDGFITYISNNGNNLLNSTYYGSSEYDQIFFVELDRFNNTYLFGQTEIIDSSFIENALWSIPGSGQFVSKLNSNLSERIYSTVFGSGDGINISPTAFLVDLCNKIYLAGWGGTVNNLGFLENNAGYTFDMPISADAFQSDTDSSDFYIIVIEDDASGFVYGSYYGGNQSAEHVDGGTSRFDKKGKIYQAICAGCGTNSDLPIFPDSAFSPVNNSNCNLGVFKMEFELPYVLADFELPSLECAPITHNFVNTSVVQSSTTFIWDFGDGETSNLANPNHNYENAGSYEIKLIVTDINACNLSDTIVKTLLVIGDSSYYLPNVTICNGESSQIGIPPIQDSNFTYIWYPDFGVSNINSPNPFASPSQTTNYSLLITNGNCVDTAFQTVNVNNPTVNILESITLCNHNDIIEINANGEGNSDNFIWSTSNTFNDIINSSLNDSVIEVSPDQSTWYYIMVTKNNCSKIDSIYVNVPIGSISISGDSSVCFGDTILLKAVAHQNQELISFQFSPDSIAVTNPFNDSVFFNPYTDQYVNLFAFDSSSGCSLYDSIYLKVDSLPILSSSATSELSVIAPGSSTQLFVVPDGFNYEWEPISSLTNPGSQDPIASPDISTTYIVNIKSGNCIKSDSVTIIVTELNCGEPHVFVPNAFSPNKDNKNDKLTVRGKYISEENFEFKIFDRLGNLVFKTNNPSTGWEGNYLDSETTCKPGVFVYYLDMKCLDGQSYFKKGNVTLLK